jgi:hypothetical protein
MRVLRLIVTAAAFAPAVGCGWMKEHVGDKGPAQHPTGGKLPDVAPDRLVSYLNDRASRFHSVSYADVRLRCSQRGMPLPQLEGDLACAQPRNFRLAGQGRAVPAKVDLGSNVNQFWMYLQVPTEKPLYVFASHSDFEAGKARLPGDMPFEPDWVMQALGMTTLSPTAAYSVKINDRDRTYTLSWVTRTPAGLEIRKEIVFDGDAAASPRPQVKRHAVRDAKSNQPICSADIKAAQSVTVSNDPTLTYPMAIQYPTRVVLRWEEQKFEMDMTLERAQVNQPLSDEVARELFSRPTISKVNAVDLAQYTYK